MQKMILTALAVLCLGVISMAQPTSGLVAYFSMNGNFNDAGPYGITVTNTGVTATTNGLNAENRAMFFNNTLSTSYTIVPATCFGSATINSNINFSQSASYTISHWFKINSLATLGSGSGFFDNNLNYAGYGTSCLRPGGGSNPIQVIFYAGNFNVQSPAIANNINLNTWYHLTAVKNGSTLTLYINGTQVATATGTIGAPSYTYNPKFGTMWANGWGNYGPLNGAIDELRIYNRALSAAEITMLTVLPVQLTRFTAVKTGADVLLQWQTQQEQNSSHFTVQRSYDGVNFEAIATIIARGNSNTETAYNYTDNAVFIAANTKTVFYRLQQYDADGKRELSNILSVKYSNPKAVVFTILQNPVPAQLQLQLQLTATQQVLLQITDAQGRIVKQQKNNLSPGRQIVLLPVAELAGGIYHITVITATEKQTQSFIKN
ncbi:MAG: LamG-like jellyroll fold domain-containing protein [Flavihumibacter sp.]|nr:LamG-like jellyroll fold domain-containing protein [Flavihumibacter sp.]